MNQPSSPSQPNPSASTTVAASPGRKRRRWLRWLLAIFLLVALLVTFLPNILALPFCRQRLLDLTFSRLNTKATVGDLSLSWFSPVTFSNLELQPENTDRAALAVQHVEGNISLLHLLFGHSLGGFRISEPELYVHFDSEGTNITRLIRGLASLSLGNRSARFEVVNGHLLLQGQNSPQPWQVDGLNLNLALSPANTNTVGVPVLSGEKAQLLNQMDLTPEMCNDLLKFITPPLFQATRTTGKVSLELDDFAWPLGKPDAATLKGLLTLHSVDVVPGPITQLLNSVFQNQTSPLVIHLTKDDEVAFNMHDGRIYHENLIFHLSASPVEIVAQSHGSVGLDESLDLFIEFQFPALQTADLTGHPFLKLLADKPIMHVVGTLSQPKISSEGLAGQVLKTGIDWLRQRRDNPSNDHSQPDTAPSR